MLSSSSVASSLSRLTASELTGALRHFSESEAVFFAAANLPTLTDPAARTLVCSFSPSVRKRFALRDDLSGSEELAILAYNDETSASWLSWQHSFSPTALSAALTSPSRVMLIALLHSYAKGRLVFSPQQFASFIADCVYSFAGPASLGDHWEAPFSSLITTATPEALGLAVEAVTALPPPPVLDDLAGGLTHYLIGELIPSPDTYYLTENERSAAREEGIRLAIAVGSKFAPRALISALASALASNPSPAARDAVLSCAAQIRPLLSRASAFEPPPPPTPLRSLLTEPRPSYEDVLNRPFAYDLRTTAEVLAKQWDADPSFAQPPDSPPADSSWLFISAALPTILRLMRDPRQTALAVLSPAMGLEEEDIALVLDIWAQRGYPSSPELVAALSYLPDAPLPLTDGVRVAPLRLVHPASEGSRMPAMLTAEVLRIALSLEAEGFSFSSASSALAALLYSPGDETVADLAAVAKVVLSSPKATDASAQLLPSGEDPPVRALLFERASARPATFIARPPTSRP